MTSKLFHKIAATLSLMLLFSSSTIFAQSSKINWTRMQRDLNIMERILDELLSEPASDIRPVIAGFSNNGAKGIYFGGYGVVFQIDLGTELYDVAFLHAEDAMLAAEAREEALRKGLPAPPKPDEDPVVVVDGSSGVIINKENWSMEKRVERLKNQGTEFLSDYADAIGQLQDSDRITLLITFDQRHSIFQVVRGRNRATVNQSKEVPSGLEITVKKNDIVEFRKGKIERPAFEKRIVFKERLSSDRGDKNIEIMANILSTALDRKYRDDFSSKGKNRGTYLDGLGALFFMRGQLLQERDIVTYQYYLDKYLREDQIRQEVATEKEAKAKNPEDQIQESLDNFKNELIELIADYGHTLRTIKPAEHVVVSIDFKDREAWHFNFKTPMHVILKVKKSHLDDYDRGTLTLTALRKKVELQEY